ncbi:unnamed protein product [Peniophora sp. CBMAI 1063]|nr:unnamed protein product [Peniophora sp. CBMAI 1063]
MSDAAHIPSHSFISLTSVTSIKMRSNNVVLVPLDATLRNRRDPPCYCFGSDSPCARCREHRRWRLGTFALIFILDIAMFVIIPTMMKFLLKDAHQSLKPGKTYDYNRGAVDIVTCCFLVLLLMIAVWMFSWTCAMTAKTLRPRSEVARRVAQLGLFSGRTEDALNKRWPLPGTRPGGLPKYTP